LERRTFESVINTMKQSEQINNKSNHWPPDKYQNVKSSGYGRDWSPQKFSQQQRIKYLNLSQNPKNKKVNKKIVVNHSDDDDGDVYNRKNQSIINNNESKF
jgi:hypothetical protein